MDNSNRLSATPDPPAIDQASPDDGQPASPEPSTTDGEHAATETDLWVGRTHWKHYAGRLLLWVAALGVAAAVLWLVATRTDVLSAKSSFYIWILVFVGTGLEVVGRRTFLTIIGHRYRLTTQRLFLERGILSQTIDQTELIRVDDVRLHRSLADRLFGLGSVAIVSTDSTDSEIVIPGIAEPEQVAEAIRGRMRMMRRQSLFIENL